MADWRQQGTGGKASESVPTTTGTRAWQQLDQGPAAVKRPWSRQSKLAFALGGLSLLVGLVVGLIYAFQPIKPACLVLIGSAYDDNLAVPHNAYGWKSLLDLQEAADQSGVIASLFRRGEVGKLRLQFGPRNLETGASWDTLWAEVPRNFRERTAVICLALHGTADAKEPLLLANDPRGQKRISVEKIIRDLGGPEFKDKNIVLILDAAQVRSHWPSGMLHNGFAGQLKKLSKLIEEQPNLIVLVSAGEDQVSHISEEWRRPIFMHYVIEGLRGPADAAPLGNGNDRVDAGELFRYVRERVKTWVQANRQAVQEPFLLGGESRASGMELVQIEPGTSETGAGFAPGAVFTPPAELEENWREFQELQSAVPGPAVYTPHLWKQYRDTLLRYEQLVRAGDPTRKAVDLKSQLSQLKDTMQRAGRVDAGAVALGRTFAMPAALGFKVPWSEKDSEAQFQKLWRASNEDALRSAWSQVAGWVKSQAAGGDEKAVEQLARLDLSRQLVRHVATKANITDEELKPGEANKPRAVLRWIERLAGERGAETHYLVMLLQYLDPAVKERLPGIQQALRVRLLAEEAALGWTSSRHPYSEVVYLAVKSQIAEADELRQRGEDWLFGSTKAAWDKADEYFQQAQKTYEGARADAELVQRALDLRDRVLADLPYFALWLAGPKSSTFDQERQALLGQVERLARDVHALDQHLEGQAWQGKGFADIPQENNIQGHTRRKLLQELSARLAHDFDDPKDGIRAVYARICEGLSDVQIQPRWHALEEVLSVPLLVDPALRSRLLRTSRELSSRLNAGTVKSSAKILSENGQDVLDSIQRQHQLLLALLGPTLRREQPSVVAETNNREALLRTALEIGKFWQTMPETANLKLQASLADTDLRKAVKDLEPIDYYTRHIWGGQVAFLEREPVDAVQGLRRLRLHDLYLWQARRFWQDHWFTEPERQSESETYYEPAAKSFLQVAVRFAESRPEDADLNRQRQGEARKLQGQITKAGLKLEAPLEQYWTSEKVLKVKWTVSADPDVPAGVPMRWEETKKEGSFEIVDEHTGRKPMLNKLPDPGSLRLKKRADQAGKVMMHVLYRGQLETLTQEIKVDPEPNILVQNVPPPPSSAVALRMDKDFNYGAVCLVLDTSGSMTFGLAGNKGLKPGEKNRYQLALEALDPLLKSIPKGTQLSLVTFEIAQQGKTGVKLVESPFAWQPASDHITFMRRLRRLVDDVKLGVGTPLLDAFDLAMRRGFPKNFEGPRLLLVLTDGDDTDSLLPDLDPRVDQAAYNAALNKRFIRDYHDAGADVRIVLFNAKNTKEARNAADQFRGIEKFIPPGSFETADDPVQLGSELRRALQPSLKLYEGPIQLRNFPVDGLFAHPYEEEETYYQRVPPGPYEGRIQQRGPQQLELRDGDMLLLALKLSGERMFFERMLFAPSSGRTLAADSTGGWLVSAVQNRIDQGYSALDNLVIVENAQNKYRPGDIVRHVQPGFMWYEVQPVEPDLKKRPLGQLRWQREYFYPAPAVRLTTKNWPYKNDRPAATQVKLWMSSKTFLENDAYTYMVPRHSKKLGEPIKVGGQTVLVEDIDVEDRPVPRLPGSSELVTKPCVVVRLSHDVHKPVWVQLRPGSPAGSIGEEHQFFTRVGRTTAIFWDVPNVQTDPFTLQLVALDAFQRTVEPVVLTLHSPTTSRGPTPIRKLYEK